MSESPMVEPQELILDPGAIADKPRETVHPGVTSTILWQRGKDVAGLLRFEPGAVMPEHRHDEAEHHVWLVDGRLRVDGHTVTAGAYWHVPAGVPHKLEGAGPEPCTIFYLYLTR
jgi:quercetin dioxygenase-like cupin family protein